MHRRAVYICVNSTAVTLLLAHICRYCPDISLSASILSEFLLFFEVEHKFFDLVFLSHAQETELSLALFSLTVSLSRSV